MIADEHRRDQLVENLPTTWLASATSFGGAIYSKNGTLQIYNTTITENNATAGRELYVFAVGAGQTATWNVYSSIIARADKISTFDVVAASDQGGNLFVAGGNNLIRSQNGFQSITVSTDPPLLAALANNGGPTLTHLPLSGSPAIDQGSNPQSLNNDQRGTSYLRTIGSGTDIGSFEVQTVPAPALPGDYNGNHFVDAADYVLWRKTMGASVTQYSGADGDGSSTVDAGDYTVWRTHFGPASGAGATSPSSLSMKGNELGQADRVEPVPFLSINTTSTSLRASKDGLIPTCTDRATGSFFERARDAALLSLTNGNLGTGLPERSSRWRFRYESIRERAVDSEAGHLGYDGLTQARLQMQMRAAASICKA
jgi:hypothetical protein